MCNSEIKQCKTLKSSHAQIDKFFYCREYSKKNECLFLLFVLPFCGERIETISLIASMRHVNSLF